MSFYVEKSAAVGGDGLYHSFFINANGNWYSRSDANDYQLILPLSRKKLRKVSSDDVMLSDEDRMFLF